jgi:hypothetical protein
LKETTMPSESGRALPAFSLTFRLRLAKAVGELDSACRVASEGSWHDFDRSRAREIATALARACDLEGLRNSATLARSIAFLMRTSRQQILGLGAPFDAKLVELLSSLQSTTKALLTMGVGS